jgi:lysophospholipase L1-like esterase
MPISTPKQFLLLVITMLHLCRSALATECLSSAVKIDDVSVTVPAGIWNVAGREVEIKRGGRFFVRNDAIHIVRDEPLQLSPKKPDGFWIGTKLQGPRTYGPLNAINSLRADTLVLRRTKNGPPLALGRDYLLSPTFALVGLGPETDLTAEDIVYASYEYGVHRLDSVVLRADGSTDYVQGTAGTGAIHPPEIEPDTVRLFNVYRPYGTEELHAEHLFFAEIDASAIPTGTTLGRIPKTLQKLKNGEPVTIVCLGDSVTAGADIANPSGFYIEQFRAALHGQFSPEQIKLHNISIGGSRSIQWLHDGNYPRFPEHDPAMCTFKRVTNLHPDLVTIEFVNDTTLTPEELESSYNKMGDELQALGAEIILITPHFTHQSMMKVPNGTLRPGEKRPYVAFLRDFAERKKLGLADAASRWEQSWKEGIPYMTLLANHYNHPSAEGNRFFAQELIKCFDETK